MATKKKATKKKATKKKATKKTTDKKAAPKKVATKYNYVAVSMEGEFFACTELPIFADGHPYWGCPDGHYASFGSNCCGERSKQTTPTAKIKHVDPLNVHLTMLVDDDYGTNVPYVIEYSEYETIFNNEKGAGTSKGKTPCDVYRTAF